MAVFRARNIRRGPLPFRYVLLLSFVFFIFSTAAGLWIVNKGIKPTLIDYAESQTKKIAPLVINKAIKEVLPNVKDIREVTEIVPNGVGGTSVQFKTDIINETASELSRAIQQNLKKAESGNLQALEAETDVEIDYEKSNLGEGIVYSFPLGQATHNALLGNLGPRIPIRFTAIGSVQTNAKPKVEQYPINNVFITVEIQIEVTVQIIIPFGTKQAVVQQDVPIALGYYPGNVPQFYNGNGKTSPSIQLPSNP
ncbi:sporulation protein YunB [Lederbergia citrea]|uniref:Sporulation protein YunB n=1 Tax=Lederbergia citrea TaxID=2833581 RepID=A0A942ULH9_9BACI|nr:sporulation protein YunB [Lederbergia citrea]MBS4178546.1 sporulation protein YunB [Lederbergia citrea]MBS4205234.1 sporulation protein YunB [Lederbergia citrea]MBS4222905.1 sporulation protein YunB [Lederbergia citrea]